MRKRKTARNAAYDRDEGLAIQTGPGPAEPCGDKRGGDQGHQHVDLRQVIFSRQFSEDHDKHHRPQTNAESTRVYLATGERKPDAVEHMLLSGATVPQAGQVAKLAES